MWVLWKRHSPSGGGDLGYVLGQVVVEALRRLPRDHQAQAAEEARQTFEALWLVARLASGSHPRVKVLHGLNRRLSAAGYRTVSFVLIANEMLATEVPAEDGQLPRLCRRGVGRCERAWSCSGPEEPYWQSTPPLTSHLAEVGQLQRGAVLLTPTTSTSLAIRTCTFARSRRRSA